MNVIDALCTQLPKAFCEIDELAAILLRFCRGGAGHLRLAYDDDEVCHRMHEGSMRVQAWFEDELDEDWLDGDDIARVANELRAIDLDISALVSPEQSAVVAARAVAEAIDLSHGRRFAGLFRSRRVCDINTGDPVPILRPPLKELYGDRLGPNPASLGLGFDELTRLRIMPQLLRGHTVRLSYAHEDLLADLRPDTQVAVATPCDVSDALVFDLEHTPHPRFTGVRPKDPALQRETVLSLLDEAAARGARIVVLPELCLDTGALDAVKKWFATSDHQLALLVCGSVHAERDGKRRNVCTTILPGGETVEHHKFNPFFLRLRGADGESVEYREDIAINPSIITVHMSTEWSFTTLICKDFLEPEVDRILEELQVNLILIPACSPKTDVFEKLAQGLTAHSQAIIVVSNLADPGVSNPASAIVVSPTLQNSNQTIRRSQFLPPHLHFFDLFSLEGLD